MIQGQGEEGSKQELQDGQDHEKEVKPEVVSRSGTWAGHTASHSLQAMHLSSPLAYLRSMVKTSDQE